MAATDLCESAGLPMNKLAGSNTSVFVGAFASDFLSSLEADQEASIKSKALGTSNSIMSNRVSWFFDFKVSVSPCPRILTEI